VDREQKLRAKKYQKSRTNIWDYPSMLLSVAYLRKKKTYFKNTFVSVRYTPILFSPCVNTSPCHDADVRYDKITRA